MCNTDKDISHEENYYRQELVDLQAIIRAQDFKIGYLFVICFLPINQIVNIKYFLNYFIQFHEKFIIFFIMVFWMLSVIFLIIATYPRFSKEINFNSRTDEERLFLLKEDVRAVFNICKNKIVLIRLALSFIVLWSILIIAVIFSRL